MAKNNARELKRVMEIWDNERVKLGMRPGKYGQPRAQYLQTFLAENFSDQELYQLIEKFLTDPWWNQKKSKRFQDLEHLIRNYSMYMDDEGGIEGIYTGERE